MENPYWSNESMRGQGQDRSRSTGWAGSGARFCAELFAATFWSFPREFWTLDERLRCGKFSVSFQRTAKHTIIGLPASIPLSVLPCAPNHESHPY